MKVIYGIGKAKRPSQNPVLAIGVFDGLHLGHRYLLEKVVRQAKRLRGISMVMTFFPHPLHVLKPDCSPPFLVPLKQRLKLMEQLGIEVCLVVHFTRKFSYLTATRFMEEYIIQSINPQEIFIGRDFKFGHARQGDSRLLRDFGKIYGFKVYVVAPRKEYGDVISSTRIRSLIATGRLALAQRLLGRPVSILGQVRKGDGRGKTLGFPTANIHPVGQVLPPCGVYAVEVVVKNKTYRGMANIGRRPSFYEENSPVHVEVHIFDFHKNIYKREIEVRFFRKIRAEKQFISVEELMRQLRKDEQTIRMCFY